MLGVAEEVHFNNLRSAAEARSRNRALGGVEPAGRSAIAYDATDPTRVASGGPVVDTITHPESVLIGIG